MVHIFDVDNTIIKHTSAWYFLRVAIRMNLIHISQLRRFPIEYFWYKLGRPNMDFVEKSCKYFANIDMNTLVQCANTTFTDYIKPNIFTKIAEKISSLQRSGEKVIFASSSLGLVIDPLEKYFGIEGSIATELEFRDGMTTGGLVGSSMFGAKKKDGVLNWLEYNNIKLDDASFYSDSYTDIPLLELCGKPVAVNPDPFLAYQAKKRGWEILRVMGTLGKNIDNL
ncbi:MAG: HAD family phosphatase [Treponema sp.]|jgi:HAD superfamily hydrolase (TIGR01490 family)|nr:HAD family phosphatase [Treponema sp.]